MLCLDYFCSNICKSAPLKPDVLKLFEAPIFSQVW